MSYTDVELSPAAERGTEAAGQELRPEEIAQLLERWRPGVLREMRRRGLWRGAPPVEFEDQFQDVAAVLYTRRFESEDHLYRALWTGLGFRARDFWKSARRREIPYGDMFGEDAPVPSVDGVEDHGTVVADARHVEDCLSDLDERERAVYRLIRGEELSRRKAAKALGIREADVLRALYSAQQKIDRFVLLFISRRLCARRAPVVKALARSEGEPQEVQQARAHLAHCSDCLVAFREYSWALSERIAAVLPFPALASTEPLSHIDDRLIATARELASAAKRELYAIAGRGPNTGTAAEAAAGAGAGGAVATKLAIGLCVTATAGGGVVCADRLDLFAGAPPSKREATEARQPREKARTEPAAIRATTHDPPPAPTATTRAKSTPSKSSSSATRQSSPSSSQSQQEFFDAPNSSAEAGSGSSSVHSASSGGGGSSSGGSSGSSSSGGGGEFFGE